MYNEVSYCKYKQHRYPTITKHVDHA